PTMGRRSSTGWRAGRGPPARSPAPTPRAARAAGAAPSRDPSDPRRPAVAEPDRRLDDGAGPQQGDLIERLAEQLCADREAVAGQPARHADAGQPGEVA